MTKKIFLTLILGMFLISFASAGLLDTKIEFTDKTSYTLDTRIIEYNTLWEKYSPIEIKGTLGLGETKWKGAITEHTETCGQDCSSTIEIYLPEDGVLIDDVMFKTEQEDGSWNEQDVRSYQFKYWGTIQDYKTICTLGKEIIDLNGTTHTPQTCEQVKDGTHEGWVNYNVGDNVLAGEYTLELDAEKKPSRTVDWIIETQGKTINEWAVWGNISEGDDAEVILNSPTDNSISYYNEIEFNTSANVTGGATLTNMSLWTNETGSWVGYNDTTFTENGAGSVYNSGISPYNSGLISYYKMDESSGNLADSKGSNTLTSTGTITYSETGKINTAVKATGTSGTPGSNYLSKGSFSGLNEDTNTICTWFKGNGNSNDLVFWSNANPGTSSNGLRIIYESGNLIAGVNDAGYAAGTSYSWTMDSSWHYICGVFDDPNIQLWFDGVNVKNSTWDGRSLIESTDVYIFSDLGGVGADGTMTLDEMSVFNRVLTNSEILKLYSSGPSSKTQTFNRTITDDIIWNVQACDSDGDCGFAPSNYSLSIDAVAPTFSVASPTGTTSHWSTGDSDWLNVTITDTNLDTCWYDYNGTNHTFSCSTGVESTNEFPVQIDNYNITIYANDSIGNEGNSFISWNVPFFISTETYSSSILEGGTATFTLTGKTNGTDIAIANLSYNAGQNIGSISKTDNSFTITESFAVPLVTSDTNYTFFWKLTQGSATTSLSTHNQTVLNFGIDDCSAYTNVLYNFTIVDEKTQVKLIPATQNTSAKVDMTIYSTLDSSIIGGLNTSFSKINPYSICLSSNLSAGESYRIDLQNQYTADNYVTEFYNIQKSTITASSLNQSINLYNLDNTTSQVFSVTYRDSSFLPVKGALVTVQRKYIDEGVFKTVEAPLTDSNGQTLVNLELYDALYTFIFSKDGTVLSTFDNTQVKCTNLVLGQCDLTFNAVSSPVKPTQYTSIDGMTYVLSYNNDTKVASAEFTIEDGTLKTVSINVTLLDSLSTPVCSNQLTSSSGTVSCTIPTHFNNGTAVVKIYQDGVFEGQGSVYVGTNNKSLYGKNIVFLSIFMFLTLFGIGLSDNPMVTGIFLFIGALIGLGMNITANTGVVGAGATILWLFIAILLVIIKGSRRQ